jgi:hypothetical protein
MKKKLLNVIVFGIFVAAFFIPIGLLSLTVGPSRWIANYAKKAAWNTSTESNFQISIILFLVLSCSVFAFKLLKSYLNNKTFSKKTYLTLASIVIVISVSIFTFKPEILNGNEIHSSVFQNEVAVFEFGPYPNETKLNELKKEGYQGVVTLLHPMVLPAEPILLNKEIKIAEKLHLKVISIPMLPWISDNEESIEKIKKLAQTAKGKYYVHCNLGKDRAGVFKKIIEAENQLILVKSSIKHNQIKTEKPFERGQVYVVSNDVFFTPYPTDEELFHYFLNSNIKTVVNLMNPKLPEESTWIEKEKKVIVQHHQKFYNFSVLITDSEAKIKVTIEKIKKLPKPMVIHAFSTDQENSKKFLKLYQSLK